MPQVTPESTITLKLSSFLPSTLMAAMMVTSKTTMPVLPIERKKRVTKKIFWQKIGRKQQNDQQEKEDKNCLLHAAQAQGAFGIQLFGFKMQQLAHVRPEIYLPSAMKASAQPMQISRAKSMYLA